MEIVNATAEIAEQFAAEIPEMVHATGPVSYDYHFGERSLLDAAVRGSLRTPGTLFGWDATHLALEGDEMLGYLVTFHAPEFLERRHALTPVWGELIAAGEIDESAIAGLVQRAEHASWLNPAVRPGIQYIHAIAVKPEQRGKQIGGLLFDRALELGREQGYRALELDVLSDNPAVQFYLRKGMELLVESRAPKPEEFGVPPEWRMGMKL